MKMPSLRSPGLGVRLAVASVALSGVLLFGYGWLASELAERTLKNELGEKLSSVARLAGADEKVRALAYAIRAGAVVEAARPHLAQVRAGADVGNIMVVDAKNRVIVDVKGRYKFRDEGWQLRLDRAEIKRVWKGETASSPVYAGEDGGLYLSAYAPLVVDGRVRAVIAAEASAAFLVNVRRLRTRLWAIGGVVLAIAAVLGLMMAQTITRPLRKLREAVERVEHGDFTATARVRARHEVGDLSRAFNRMAQAVNVRHGLILENMSNGLVAVDRQGNVAELNSAGEELLELKRDGVLGRHFQDHLPPELAEAMEDTLNGNEPLKGEKVTVRIPDGAGGTRGARILQVSTAPIRDADQALRGAELMFLDVTEMERLTAAYEAQQRFAAIGQVAAEVAHQIRNPLAAIQSFADLLRPGIEASGQSREFLEDLIKEVKTTEGIVGSFLQFARPSRLELGPVRAAETVEGVVRSMRPEFEQAGIGLERKVDEPLPEIRADEKAVGQALANLLRNALEACRRGGNVQVRVTASNGASPGVTISIEDDGTGLAPEIVPKLFTPFATTKARGTGLGLSLAKKYVEAHGGAIALSPLPKGTRAEVQLPVEPITDEV